MIVTFDNVTYTAKPTQKQYAERTQRLKAAKPQDVSAHDFCAHVQAGGSWVGGAFTDGLKTLVQWQVAALDFDDGMLSPVEALNRCELLGISPLCLYFTLSATLEKPRFRLVFTLDEPVSDEQLARECIGSLLSMFPEADQNCRNPNKIYLGSQGEVWACHEVWFV